MSERPRADDTPETTDSAPAAPRATPAGEPSQIEPLLGIAEFSALAQIRPYVRKPLETWMRTVAKKDPHGHYPLQEWQEFYTEMLAYS